MHDLVDRYQRRLDHELHKFKMELEADNRGITEVLEKRKSFFLKLINIINIVIKILINIIILRIS